MPPRANQLRTRAVHAGEDPSLAVRSLSDPISPGGVFAFRDALAGRPLGRAASHVRDGTRDERTL
jgi:hypothetical protein